MRRDAVWLLVMLAGAGAAWAAVIGIALDLPARDILLLVIICVLAGTFAILALLALNACYLLFRKLFSPRPPRPQR